MRSRVCFTARHAQPSGGGRSPSRRRCRAIPMDKRANCKARSSAPPPDDVKVSRPTLNRWSRLVLDLSFIMSDRSPAGGPPSPASAGLADGSPFRQARRANLRAARTASSWLPLCMHSKTWWHATWADGSTEVSACRSHANPVTSWLYPRDTQTGATEACPSSLAFACFCPVPCLNDRGLWDRNPRVAISRLPSSAPLGTGCGSGASVAVAAGSIVTPRRLNSRESSLGADCNVNPAQIAQARAACRCSCSASSTSGSVREVCLAMPSSMAHASTTSTDAARSAPCS